MYFSFNEIVFLLNRRKIYPVIEIILLLIFILLKGEITLSWFSVLKDILEVLYYLSGIGLLLGVIIAIQQLKLMKKDFNVKNQRASIEKSIEYLHLFATEYIPKASKLLEDLSKKNIQFYKGPINKEFYFDNNCNLGSDYIKKNLIICAECGAIDVLNRFEYFSAALISGLADEELAFNPLASFYCEIVESLYVPLCYSRRNGLSTAYSNTIKLYNIWKARLDKLELEKKRSELDKEISKIQVERIQSIWKKTKE
jgi:hypothetical protein